MRGKGYKIASLAWVSTVTGALIALALAAGARLWFDE